MALPLAGEEAIVSVTIKNQGSNAVCVSNNTCGPVGINVLATALSPGGEPAAQPPGR
jgi:hypothetical protein